MGIGALFGLGKKPASTTTVAKTLTATPLTPKPLDPLAMPDSVRTSSAGAAMMALSAAQKARRKAAGGATSSVAQPTGTILTSTAAPKTLLGY